MPLDKLLEDGNYFLGDALFLSAGLKEGAAKENILVATVCEKGVAPEGESGIERGRKGGFDANLPTCSSFTGSVIVI